MASKESLLSSHTRSRWSYRGRSTKEGVTTTDSHCQRSHPHVWHEFVIPIGHAIPFQFHSQYGEEQVTFQFCGWCLRAPPGDGQELQPRIGDRPQSEDLCYPCGHQKDHLSGSCYRHTKRSEALSPWQCYSSGDQLV